MKHSQINHAKAWGFSRRTSILDFSPEGRFTKSVKEVPLYQETSTISKFLNNQRNLQWLKQNIHISTQVSIPSMLRLQVSSQDFTANLISTITSFGYQNTENQSLEERWLKC